MSLGRIMCSSPSGHCQLSVPCQDACLNRQLDTPTRAAAMTDAEINALIDEAWQEMRIPWSGGYDGPPHVIGRDLALLVVRRALLAQAAPVAAQELEFDRDTDGELLIDWSPSQGRMLTLSLRDDGRLSYAVTWDGEKFHGQVQMPRASSAAKEKL